MWSGNLLHRCQSLEGRRVSRPSGQKKNMTYIYLKRWHIRRKEWEGWAWRKAAEREELHGRKTMCLSLQGCRITWRWDGDPGKQQYCSSPRISGRATPLQQFLFFIFSRAAQKEEERERWRRCLHPVYHRDSVLSLGHDNQIARRRRRKLFRASFRKPGNVHWWTIKSNPL